jgi:hypothetical protein
LLSLAVFVLLAVAHTWPLASAPAHWSRVDGDGGMNTWTLAWVAHAILTDPARIFDGNIFHPNRLTVAYSEAMLLQSLFALPVIAAGGSAVLAYNVAAIAGFALTGWAFCLLLHRWTGSWTAGYVAGSLAGFNAFTLTNLTHMQFLHAGFIALMLFAIDRVISRPRYRDAAVLAVGFAFQAFASLYLMAFAVVMLLLMLAARVREWVPHAGALFARLAVAGVVAFLLLAPYLWPYWRLQQTERHSRGIAESEAASWTDYAATGARLHFDTWSRRIGGSASTYAFPGFVALALTAVALRDRKQRRDPRVWMSAAAAAGCVAISFAPSWPFYPAWYAVVPLFQAVRAVHRIAQVMLLMVAVVAGFGAAAVARRWGASRMWPVAAAVLIILVNGEALRAPLGLVRFDGVPAVYDTLAQDRSAVIVEAPFPMPQQWFLNSRYMVNSTRHWRPMLNGYSSYRPPSYYESYEIMQAFPADASLIALHHLGITHVVVHVKDMPRIDPARYDPYDNVPSLQLVTRDDDVLIYRLRR